MIDVCVDYSVFDIVPAVEKIEKIRSLGKPLVLAPILRTGLLYLAPYYQFGMCFFWIE